MRFIGRDPSGIIIGLVFAWFAFLRMLLPVLFDPQWVRFAFARLTSQFTLVFL